MLKLFLEMIEVIPPRAALTFVERERQALEDDLVNKRINESLEVYSVLNFCEFIKVVSRGKCAFTFDRLPLSHIVSYKKIVARLVEAGELPFDALSQFEKAYLADFCQRLAQN